LREGTVDLVTVLQTQQTLYAAEDALAQARLAHVLAIVSLYQALGGGWLPKPVVTADARGILQATPGESTRKHAPHAGDCVHSRRDPGRALLCLRRTGCAAATRRPLCRRRTGSRSGRCRNTC